MGRRQHERQHSGDDATAHPVPGTPQRLPDDQHPEQGEQQQLRSRPPDAALLLGERSDLHDEYLNRQQAA
jgi:hypothetical protein